MLTLSSTRPTKSPEFEDPPSWYLAFCERTRNDNDGAEVVGVLVTGLCVGPVGALVGTDLIVNVHPGYTTDASVYQNSENQPVVEVNVWEVL
mmetsp:Transcript_23024/g.38560  ORF Transcript_23024/g.38560 Transcript_23024/m.38560 type:complete len:92 (-) Transcript_23024:1355-1630(-)